MPAQGMMMDARPESAETGEPLVWDMGAPSNAECYSLDTTFPCARERTFFCARTRSVRKQLQ
jgi:hypothetical protein